MARIRRLLFLFRLFLLEGTKRANYLKRKNYFKSQGDNCYFAIYNFGTEPDLLSFGDNVVIATSVRLVTHDMTAWMISRYLYDIPDKIMINKGITFGSNIFVGAESIILPGVNIGSNVVIGAGSVVTKDVSDNSVVAGNPAKYIKPFDELVKKIS